MKGRPMAANSKIEWTECTWNPVTGCTKISEGCRNCYAERMARRLQAMGQANYRDGFKLTLHPHMLEMPLHWRQPRMIFVNSMSDLFHEDVPLAFIQKVFGVMQRAPQHHFQVLTKRSERLVRLSPKLPWPDNVWMGVTVENSNYTSRIRHLRQTSANVKFISIEPLLGPIPDIDLDGIDWTIVGGESGPGARPMRQEWAAGIRDQCLAAGVSFFFKQWGGINKKMTGRILDNRTWDERPRSLTRREANHAGIGAACR
ncbi:MAG TPA: phage Gp37/Gp68 family protein [Sedimentisphaerales bacterium]|nr:phage Gp37/Gp68 family protein [Sedimentisphaerales bacterium]